MGVYVNMNKVFGNKRRGGGMMLAFFALTIVFIFGATLVSMGWSSLNMSKRDSLRARALACAEAGADQAEAWLMGGGPSGSATPGQWRYGSTGTPSSYYPLTIDGSDNTALICSASGSGTTNGKIVVTSIGTAREGSASATRTIRVVLDLRKENVSVWNNVIFGGVGQAGKSINGNVVIRGSVHLLGDGEPYTDVDGDGHWDSGEYYVDSNHNSQYDLGEYYVDVDGDGHRDAREPFQDNNGNGTRDPALTVTDMAEEISGNANVGNNYNGMSATLRALVPSPPQTVFGGETVDSLSAKLRVKHGKVNISGSATCGNANIAGDANKETLDGTYVSDGFGGNQGTNSVYSDNGYANGYDLGDGVVQMPIIDAGSYTKDGVTYSNYLTYLKANATVVTGDQTFTNGVAKSIIGPKGSIVMDASGNMTITGMVFIDGNISFGPKQSRITYEGSGTIVTPDSFYVHCDLLPKVNFPRHDALGMIAGDQIQLATGSGDAQLTMAIAMYAQHKVVSVKQSQIAGTIVGSYYEMSNVPSIYQVPDLSNYLPPGLPGGDPIWIVTLDVLSWQEI